MNQQANCKLLLNIRETCEALSLGRTTLFELMHRGDLTPVRIGRAVRFRVQDLERYVEQLPERGA